MYEHPYLALKVSEHEQERIQQAAERRRFLLEHADQIVPRGAGPIRRLGQRMLRVFTGSRSDAARDAAADGPAASASAPTAAAVMPASSPSGPRDLVGCAPATAR